MKVILDDYMGFSKQIVVKNITYKMREIEMLMEKT